MKFLLLNIMFLIVCTSALRIRNSELTWEEYKDIFNKKYSETEETSRRSIFDGNVKEITKHNARYLQQLESFKKGVNQFTDQTPEERRQFSKSHTTVQMPRKKSPQLNRMLLEVPIPESFNWVEKGAVTPVKDQQHCGSCYAFGSTVAFEAQYYLKTGVLRNLSEQNLIDCTTNGNEGCEGGFADECFAYALDQGLMFQEDYEYIGNVSGSCDFQGEKSVFPLEDYFVIDGGDEEMITRMIATVGPVTVSLDDRFFHDYAEGILDQDTECTDTNHVVALVGYGRDAETGKEYYLAKNSWGDWWGDNGYVKLARNVNYCTLADYAVAPLL